MIDGEHYCVCVEENNNDLFIDMFSVWTIVYLIWWRKTFGIWLKTKTVYLSIIRKSLLCIPNIIDLNYGQRKTYSVNMVVMNIYFSSWFDWNADCGLHNSRTW